MSDNFLKCTPPTPSKYLSRKSVITAIGIFGFLLALAIIIGKNRHELKKTDTSSLKSYPSNSLNMLPSNYSEIKPPPPPKPLPFEVDQTDTELLKRLARLREERLKRADEARRAGVSFQGVSVQTDRSGQIAEGEKEVSSTSADSPDALNPRDSDNRQDEKLSFLDSKHSSSTLLRQHLKSSISEYQLMGGTIISGIMITGINSDLPGEIVGQVSQNVFDTVTGAHLLIPQGTKIMGEYDSRIVYGQERVLVVWTRLIFPNGKSISLEGMPGVDLSGYAGLSDQVNNHYLKLLTGVVFSSFLSAGAQMANGRSFNSINPSFDELAMQGVARNLNNVGQQITNKNLNIQPTLEIRPGYRFNVFVNKDMVLERYGE